MMLRLIRDVFLYAIDLRGAHAKRTVTLLPREERVALSAPAAGIALQRSYNVGQLCVFGQVKQNVQMIGGASDGEHVSSVISSDRREVVPQSRFERGADQLGSLSFVPNTIWNRELT